MAEFGSLEEAAGTVFRIIVYDRGMPLGPLLSREFTTPTFKVSQVTKFIGRDRHPTMKNPCRNV